MSRENFNELLNMNSFPKSAAAAVRLREKVPSSKFRVPSFELGVLVWPPRPINSEPGTQNPEQRQAINWFNPIALLGAAGLIALAGCAKPQAPDPTILATVGDRVIRVEDVQREIAWRQRPSARRR